MKLYYSPGACSLSPHIIMREAGLEPALTKVDVQQTHLTEGGEDFYKINPKGYVPVLVLDNGSKLTEGVAIVQYLADLKPEAGLAPANGSFERYHLQELLNFISTEIHKSFGPFFDPSLTAEQRAAQVEKLGKRFTLIANELGDKPFLLGDKFSVADAYLFTVLGWTKFVQIDLGPWPTLQAFIERVAARPAVQAALRAEGLLQ